MNDQIIKWLWRRFDLSIEFWFCVWCFMHGHITAAWIFVGLIFLETYGVNQAEKEGK